VAWRRGDVATEISQGYLPILILALVGLGLVFVTLLAASFVAPKNPTRRKTSTYECGEVALGSGRGPIAIQYYMYILVFLILDIEAVFLIPFAVEFLELSLQGILVMLVFVLMLLEGWAYAWSKGALEWSA
jgi:NADH-quinone oxidoreductase subunit A